MIKIMKLNPKLLVAIDIGNSTVGCGFYRNGVLRGFGSYSSYNIPKIVKIIDESGVSNNNVKVIISSGVPKFTLKIEKVLSNTIPGKSVYIVGKDVFPKVKMKYKRKLLGADRLVNVYGAIRKYRLPILVIDFGTAITFDFIGKSGVFEGGLIVPGVETSFRALGERTALLPKSAKIRDVSKLIGRNTKSAMCSGLLNGFGALADGLIGRFKREYASNLKVLATGGFAKRMARYARKLDYVDPLHTVRSLALIYQNEIEEKSR